MSSGVVMNYSGTFYAVYLGKHCNEATVLFVNVRTVHGKKLWSD
jgi:hypothetical protein